MSVLVLGTFGRFFCAKVLAPFNMHVNFVAGVV